MTPLDCTPSVHQLSENLDREPPMEGAAPSRRGGIPDTMRGRRKRVAIKKRSLLSLAPISQGLLEALLQRGLTTRRIRRERNFNLQETSLMLLSLIRTIYELVLKRRGGSKKAYVLLLVGKTQSRYASKDPRTRLDHQEASLASREKPELG
ncbi:hypothetical protein O181_013879 [Austropuccinia psidii MF-1]|uniref:Uncharacterized protein n=1 Tax=Austropuccinia psidii MF-1 TaxID=1389203 RepID=A0A9Q3BX77_9BASI|nr:hypothetical protein [Austropuccinia psidii MF-1]